MNEANKKPKLKTVEQIYKEALKLSDDEREKLVVLLEQDGHADWASPDIKQAWIEECDRRMKLIDEGKAGWVDGEQFMRNLRKSLAK